MGRRGAQPSCCCAAFAWAICCSAAAAWAWAWAAVTVARCRAILTESSWAAAACRTAWILAWATRIFTSWTALTLATRSSWTSFFLAVTLGSSDMGSPPRAAFSVWKSVTFPERPRQAGRGADGYQGLSWHTDLGVVPARPGGLAPRPGWRAARGRHRAGRHLPGTVPLLCGRHLPGQPGEGPRGGRLGEDREAAERDRAPLAGLDDVPVASGAGAGGLPALDPPARPRGLRRDR